jgi:glycogen debranching enzyme
MSISQENRTQRATPAVPMPGVTKDQSVPSTEGRNLPPELGPEAIAILEGRSFMYSDPVGDVPGGSIGGLVHADTRFLSRWQLTINGAPFLALRSGVVDHYSAAFFLTNDQLPGLMPNSIGIRRIRFVGQGLHERIELESFATQPLSIELRMATGNDFADLFEIKDVVRDRSAEITRDHAADGSRLTFKYRHDTFEAETTVNVSTPADVIDGDDLVWRLDIPPRGTWSCEFHVPLKLGPNEIQPIHNDFGQAITRPEDSISRWERERPHLTTDSPLLDRVIQQSAADVSALRITVRADGEDIPVLGAGLPWFLTLFGRDTLITALQGVAFGPAFARGALVAFATLQGKERNDFRDEEPGKILHEFRAGELTQLGIKPHNPYYGTADATQLWLILASEYWRWTGDSDLIRSLRPNIRAALDWIDAYGDRDDDGYVEYQTRSPQGLGNQCWRDSWAGVQFADGTIPALPIATCELQGYTYDAKMRIAELADGPLEAPDLARRLRREADDLKTRFNEDFWVDQRGGYFAIGLDGDKKKIDSLTSNIGHLLWSGIVTPDKAKIVRDQLMSDSLYSGWGIRTLSTQDAGFNPIGYHLGTVWPHDTSIVAAGLARYGYRDDANTLAMALLDAAGTTGYRLPEAFSGYPRSFSSFPIPYPTACSPQAWATGAPLLLLRTMLGLDVRDGEIMLDPVIPDEIGRIRITGLRGVGARWHIEAVGRTGDIRLARADRPTESPTAPATAG